MSASVHYRTVWLSDIHLGCKDCKAEFLLDFLNHCTIERLYLVGDIVDMWAMSRQFRWPTSHNALFHKLLSLSGAGTQVIYLPGNHDAPLQHYDGMDMGDIMIRREWVHTTAKGDKFLVLHGDQFDDEVCFGRLHSWIGDKGYDLLLFLNRWYNRLRLRLGRPYWSLAGYLKSRVKGAHQAISRYRQACINRAASAHLDGVICGHIHHPQICHQQGLTYCNTGDWIENCSALIEDQQGHLQLLNWTRTTTRAADNLDCQPIIGNKAA